ncbi:MAG TPA: biotin/lipoyl-containing protein [Tetragenococcus sp.]|nr:biotin/lipoyl-containing protein [Tetragenococcus sp.]
MKKQCLKKIDNLWVLFNGKEYVIGLTNEAQDELGNITFVSLPKVGQSVKKGETLVECEAEKAISEFASPLSGTISSVNEKIDEDLSTLNDKEEMNDWFLSLKDVDAAEFDRI